MTTHTPDFDGTNPIVIAAPPSQTRATIGTDRLRTTMSHPEPRRYHVCTRTNPPLRRPVDGGRVVWYTSVARTNAPVTGRLWG
jgi:hypothetical protein